MTKRILATVLAVLMVCGAMLLSACTTTNTPVDTDNQQPPATDNAGGEPTADNKKQTNEPAAAVGNFTVPEAGYDGSEVNLTFYHTMGTNLSDVLDLYIAEFNKLYPNIHIASE